MSALPPGCSWSGSGGERERRFDRDGRETYAGVTWWRHIVTSYYSPLQGVEGGLEKNHSIEWELEQWFSLAITLLLRYSKQQTLNVCKIFFFQILSHIFFADSLCIISDIKKAYTFITKKKNNGKINLKLYASN